MSEKFIYRFDLYSFEAPQFWRNFYKHIEPKKMLNLSALIQHINSELKTYNAKYIHGGPSSRLEFESEQDYVLFLLRWT